MFSYTNHRAGGKHKCHLPSAALRSLFPDSGRPRAALFLHVFNIDCLPDRFPLFPTPLLKLSSPFFFFVLLFFSSPHLAALRERKRAAAYETTHWLSKTTSPGCSFVQDMHGFVQGGHVCAGVWGGRCTKGHPPLRFTWHMAICLLTLPGDDHIVFFKKKKHMA